MDNHFVPNLTLGLPVVDALHKVSKLPIDVHLMIENADRWAPEYAQLGVDSVTFHAEASAAPIRLARELRSAGSKASMALRPATPIEPYLDMIGELDMVLLMTVEPGSAARSSWIWCYPRSSAPAPQLKAPASQLRCRSTAAFRATRSCVRRKPALTCSWLALRSTRPKSHRSKSMCYAILHSADIKLGAKCARMNLK